MSDTAFWTIFWTIVGLLHGEVRRNDRARMANRQLMTFWRLEHIWSRQSLVSHRCFRTLYNRLGPIAARRIRTPYTADMVYLMLKPAGVLAWVVLALKNEE